MQLIYERFISSGQLQERIFLVALDLVKEFLRVH